MTISTRFSRENREEKRGCCREKRKGKQTGCERKTSYSLNHHRQKYSQRGSRVGTPTHGPASACSEMSIAALVLAKHARSGLVRAMRGAESRGNFFFFIFLRRFFQPEKEKSRPNSKPCTPPSFSSASLSPPPLSARRRRRLS